MIQTIKKNLGPNADGLLNHKANSPPNTCICRR